MTPEQTLNSKHVTNSQFTIEATLLRNVLSPFLEWQHVLFLIWYIPFYDTIIAALSANFILASRNIPARKCLSTCGRKEEVRNKNEIFLLYFLLVVLLLHI